MSRSISRRAARAGTPPSGARAPTWPDDRVARLRVLWADGTLSAAEIARRLGVSRNAVLGKLHRLGLSNRRAAAAGRPPRAPRSPRAPRPVRSARAAPQPVRPVSVVGALAAEVGPGLIVHLEDLPRGGCHWPIGDPATAEFRFCGRTARRGPYCEGHRQAAYRPGRPRSVEGLVQRFVGAP